jgi:hypothetical protein
VRYVLFSACFLCCALSFSLCGMQENTRLAPQKKKVTFSPCESYYIDDEYTAKQQGAPISSKSTVMYVTKPYSEHEQELCCGCWHRLFSLIAGLCVSHKPIS